MTLRDRLRRLASALPSDGSSVTLTRLDLEELLEGEVAEVRDRERDLTVEDVAEETGRAPSTVRGWLIEGTLRGYKLNGRDWRVPRAALRTYLEAQAGPSPASDDGEAVDIGAWRRLG